MTTTTVFNPAAMTWGSSPPTTHQQRILSDAISVVSPNDAILQNALERGPNTPTWLFQWTMLQPSRSTGPAASTPDSVPAADSSTGTFPVYPSTTCFQDDELAETKLIARTSAHHMGDGDMHEIQCSLALEKLVHRQEWNFGFQEFSLGSASTDALTEGLIPWVFKSGLGRARATNVQLGGTTLGTAGVPYAGILVRHANGTPLSQDSFLDGLQESSYLGNDMRGFIFAMAPTIKRRFNDFTRLYKPSSTEMSQLTYFRNIDEKLAGVTVEYFESDQGIVELISIPDWGRDVQTYTSPDVNSLGTMVVTSDNMIVGFDPAYVKIRDFHGFFSFEPDTDGRNASTVFSYTGGLQVDNPRALIGFYNCDGTDATVAIA